MTDIADSIAKQAAALRRMEVWKNSIAVTLPMPPRTGFVIDVHGKHVIAQFIAWTTGAMEANALTLADGQVFYAAADPNVDEATLDAHWRRFCSEILRAEERKA
jgi:hypothetical protein